MSANAYERGLALGNYIIHLREQGDGSYDPRGEIGDEYRSGNGEEFMNGLNAAFEEAGE